MTTNSPSSPDLSYFGIQSEWGVTKHFGGLRATDLIARRLALAPGKSVLVVGCGDGFSACHLARSYGCRVTGVDLNPRMVDWAQQRAVRKGVADRTGFRTADAQDLPFEDGSFDAALTESVLAFVPDKPRALSELGRVVKPGGLVALNEGAWLAAPPESLVTFIRRAMGDPDFQSPSGWQALIDQAGLLLVDCDVVKMNMLQQRRDESAGWDFHDYMRRLRAVGKFFRMLLTDPAFRRYTKTLVPPRQVIKDLFTYLGYGIYIAATNTITTNNAN